MKIKSFIGVYERFLENVKSLESSEEQIVVYIWKAFIYGKRLLNVWKILENSQHKDELVFTERILKSVASVLQNFNKTLYIMFDKHSKTV